MDKKKIIILGEGQIVYDVADRIINSKEFEFGGIITEKKESLPYEFKKYDLGNDPEILIKIKPDVGIALNYHKIIPASVIREVKIMNSHAGILPENRGYHTSGWGFINRDKDLGYSLHLMDEGADSGPVLYTFKYKVDHETTFNEVKESIYKDQKKNILKIVRSYLNGNLMAKHQKIRYPKYFGKRNIADCYIDWSKSSDYIDNFIRALSIPSGPGAFTVYKNKKLIIINSQKYLCEDYIEIPGHVVHKYDERILVKTGDKCLWIDDVVYENRKMKAGNLIKRTGVRLGLNITEEILKRKKIV